MKIENLAELYEMHYFGEKSNYTLKGYQQAWEKFKVFAQEQYQLIQEQDIIDNATWSMGQLFKNSLIKEGLNPNTINTILSGLRSYFNFLVRDKVIENNPFLEVESVSVRSVTYERPYLESEEFDILMSTIATKEEGKKQDNFDLTSTRDQLAVGILLSCGLRIHELLNIKVGDIQSNGDLMVLGKGKKLRQVKISESNMIRLRTYMHVREEYAQEDCEDLFISRYGKVMSPQSFNKNLKKYLERAGLNTDVSAHGLRASSATNLLRKGVRVTKIAEMLGHSDIKTTINHYAKESNDYDFLY